MTKSKFINLLKNNRTARGVAFQLLFGILIGIFLLIIVEDILYLTLGIVSQSSNSMFHNNLSFDEYWDEQGKLFSFFGISKEEINISSDQVVSEVIFRIPYFSYLVWKFKPETNL